MSITDRPVDTAQAAPEHLHAAMAEVHNARSTGNPHHGTTSAGNDDNRWLHSMAIGADAGHQHVPGHTSTDQVISDHLSLHREFDARTGMEVSRDINNSRWLATMHIESDPVTGHETLLQDIDRRTGHVDREIRYDRLTGHRLSEDSDDSLTGRDHRVYDPHTGKMKTEDLTRIDGAVLHSAVDAKTGHWTTAARFRDGSSERTEQFSNGVERTVHSNGLTEVRTVDRDGQPETVYGLSADGTLIHSVYRPGTSDPSTIDTTRSDGTTEHMVYAHRRPGVEGDVPPQSKDIRHPNGSTDHVDYDPRTGHASRVTERSASGVERHFKIDAANGRAIPDPVQDALASVYLAN